MQRLILPMDDFELSRLLGIGRELNGEGFPHMSLAVFYRDVDELGVLGFLGGGEDKGRVGGSILGFVFVDCCGSVLSTS